ncbi:MAG: phosphoribosylformylglycinamidine synthase subunit PurQ [Candidatus Eisenbacteria bacterium]
MRWNEPVEELRAYDAYFLPGGFSYQDRIRAGAVAARLPVLDLVARAARPQGRRCSESLQRCPDPRRGRARSDQGTIDAALTANRVPERSGYYTRWIFLVPGPAAERCLFTRDLREPLPMPTAHAEGRFWARGAENVERLERQTALAFGDAAGARAETFPAVPNGSHGGAAGVCNAAGNVLALMPHPDRALRLAQVPPWLPGTWGDRRRAARSASELEHDGPGVAIFRGLARSLAVEVAR